MICKSNLVLMHLNIHSIISDSKQLLLKNLLNKYNPDVLSLNETFLKPTDSIIIEGYTIIRSDRPNRTGGGSAICIKSNLKHKEIALEGPTKNDNVCGLSIESSRHSTSIFSIYSPPNEPLNYQLFDNIIKRHKHFIIMGDFNAHNKTWFCKKDNRYGLQLESLTTEHNIQIINNKSITYPPGKSTLDLTLLSKKLATYNHSFKVLKDNISDHLPTLTTIKDFCLKREKLTFRKTNWTQLTRLLETAHSNVTTECTTKLDIGLAAQTLTDTLTSTFNSATKTITINNKPKSIVCIPRTLLNQIKLKRKIKRKLSKNHSVELRKIYNMLDRKIKAAISTIKSNNLHSNFKTLEDFKCSSSKHWKVLNNFDNPIKPKTNQTIFKHLDLLVEDDPKIAEHFAQHLHSIFGEPTKIHIDQDPLDKRPIKPTTDPPHPRSDTPSTDPDITIEEINKALISCKQTGAPGIDKISFKILKICPPNIIKQIHTIFNASLKLGHLPTTWKSSRVIMIHKSNKPKDTFSSYRPISLINCISKLLEKIVNSRILIWAEENSIFPPCQSGFRKNMSCQDHIARLDQHITEGFNKKQHTGCVMFDLEKAFDNASHQGIIHKLEKAELPTILLNWTKDFLSNRSFHVAWNNSTSSTHCIETGVPQGSCISATLFNIYFSDISNHIPDHIFRALYADDLGIMYTSKNMKEIEKNLQRAIDAISDYCQKWGFTINKTKTTYTTFCTAGKRTNYDRTYKLNLRINNSQIPLNPFPVFLGIKLDPKLTYLQHLEHISTKIMSRTKLIRKVKSLKLKNQNEICLTIFKSQIKSIIDYAFIPTISPTQKILSKLQTIQTRALRTIKHFPLKTPTAKIHEFFNIDLVATSATKLAKNFAKSRMSHPQLLADYRNFTATRTPAASSKYRTIFDRIPELL
jgi:hypothetical protein